MSARHDRLVRTLTGISYKTIGVTLVGLVFACLLIGTMSSRACRSGSHSDSAQIAYCTLALTALTPFRGEEYKRAGLYAQRGIARAELAEFMGRTVHLFLQVKVRENWLDEAERYTEIGLDFRDGDA